MLPAAFTLTAIKQDGAKLENIPCALTPGSSNLLSTIALTANESTVAGKAKKSPRPARTPRSR